MRLNDEPYISEQQQHDFDLLKKLSKEIDDDLKLKRTHAIEGLLNTDLLPSKKKNILNNFIYERINFKNQKINIDGILYKYEDLYLLAEKLFDDKTFFGNDCSYVLNALAFYENSLSFEDIIIAFHNYRIGHDNKDLWWLSLLLSRYICGVLSMDGKYKEIYYEQDETHKELKLLTNYVVDFWKQYLADVSLSEYALNDDQKNDFYKRIDDDAGHYFALQDAKNDDEIKEINTEFATYLVTQCSKSLYLLLSTLKEINDMDFSSEIKNLRRVITEICDNIYIENTDAFGELENDTRLNSDKMELIEKQTEIALLTFTLQNALDKLSGCDTQTTLLNRKEALQTIRLISDTEELLEAFSKKFSELLMNSIDGSLDSYYARIKQEIGLKYNLLPNVALNALASAEYLYDMFVKKKAPAGFDYSGIAVLYFQAFETTYDMLLVEPYANWLTRLNINKYFDERYKIRRKPSQKRSATEKNRLDELENKILIKYFSSPFDKDLFYYKKQFVTALEIGKFQRFIDISNDINNTNTTNASQLIYFLENECFRKTINSNSIKQFSDGVKNATEPRNKAAHGLHGLKECDVIADKLIVYDETNVQDIQNFKNLLYEFLNFFN